MYENIVMVMFLATFFTSATVAIPTTRRALFHLVLFTLLSFTTTETFPDPDKLAVTSVTTANVEQALSRIKPITTSRLHNRIGESTLEHTTRFVFEGLTPAIGDVRLYNFQVMSDEHYSGHAQIYLTNGINENMWSEVCNTKSFHDAESKVFCKQLNFTNGKRLPTEMKPGFPILISDINCGNSQYRHILQCSYKLTNNPPCPFIMMIECYDDEDPDLQDGTLELHSLYSGSPLVSTSFGVVGIFFKEWRAIGSKSLFPGASNLADLMCRSLGFQKAASNGIKTANAYGNKIDLTNSYLRYHNASRLYLEEMSCDYSHPYPCLECCMEYPEVDVCPGEPHCPNEFLILNCTHDLFKSDSGKRQNLPTCYFESHIQGSRIANYHSICNQEDYVMIFLTVESVILGLLLLIPIVIICYKCYRYWKNRRVVGPYAQPVMDN